jgi:hypothetical protein
MREPGHTSIGIGYHRSERLIHLVSNGSRQLADGSDSNDASKFRPCDLQSLFGAPLFLHLIQKRVVGVLEFHGTFRNPGLEAVTSPEKGIFRFSSP